MGKVICDLEKKDDKATGSPLSYSYGSFSTKSTPDESVLPISYQLVGWLCNKDKGPLSLMKALLTCSKNGGTVSNIIEGQNKDNTGMLSWISALFGSRSILNSMTKTADTYSKLVREIELSREE